MSDVMEPLAYIIALTTRLLDGLSRTPAEFRGRQAAFFIDKQNPDGGVSGREGDSDLYYTAFALRGLAILDALTPAVCERAAGFLRERATQQASVVDFFSFLFACFLAKTHGPDILADSPRDWRERVATTLETFRTADGGYAKGPGGTSGSTYHTFLVGLCYQLLERGYPRPDDVVRFLLSRRRDDGGFVEIAPMRRSGTNPTAAAVGAWQMLHGLDAEFPDKQGLIAFLKGMPSMEGGLRANDRIPLADLLSTFTGCWTLERLGALDAIATAEALRYVQSLERPAGGFCGGLWDEHTDVEYTFYGLGAVGLLTKAGG
jgi:geranylgeranyl transferase type-2 subunit beta